jgi:glycerol-3-phosphate acyltransferase PlsX
VARYISELMKAALTSSPMAKAGALLALPALKRMRQKIDPSAINGGPLLGLNGIVVKSHGGADAKGFGNAIRVAVDLGRSDYLTKVSESFGRLTAVLDQPPASPPEPGQESSQ